MTRRRSRRALLRAGAVAVTGLAGCVGSLDIPDDGRRQSDTTRSSPAETSPAGETQSTTESETTRAPTVELDPIDVRSSFFYLTTPDSLDVEAVEATQFVFVRVRPRTDAPRPSDFALVADDRHFWGTLAPGDVGGPHRLSEFGSVYRAGKRRSGWVAFEVPNPLDAEAVALTYDDWRWSLDEDRLAALRAPPPDFELVSFEAPEEVAHDESFDATVVVENAGEGDGVFRASLNQAGPAYAPHRAAVEVPAGERRERTWTFGDSVTRKTERVNLRLESAVTDRETSVEVLGGTTPDSAVN
ncbi:hypothetical protein [Halorussus sp. MSC15.2]|uniref:hypothetical protein n=1 Tax=Halorussus sp. MSC15.2 TaxID=2283638 RepID=UPI0013CFFA81|nr:hypothetical protein [Halorussus sp. MSC15.2]NEU57059.1 hypothetical protein [Halorussus sp. MSC15.2]